MSKQPTALYLAEILQSEPGAVADAASAELRRLHAEVNELKRTLALQQQSYEREIQIEVEAEREACAKVAKETVCDMHLGTGIKIYGTKAAAAIRARGNT
jgi:prefoldin subunit 5